MVSGSKPYSVLKESGVESLGEIPEHWGIRRLRTLSCLPIANGIGESAQAFRADWPRYVRITDIAGPRSLRACTAASLPPDVAWSALLDPGDILFAAVGATYGKSYLYDGMCGAACFAGYLVRLTTNDDVLPDYLSYWSESSSYWDQVHRGVIKATIENFSASRYKRLISPIPPINEQRTIVRFLDHADRRIQRYIRAKERLIELLEEQKQAFIHHAITGQIDVRTGQPYPAYEDSGVGWVGEIPAHWEVRRLKHLTHGITVGIVVTPSKYYVDQGVPCLRSLNVSGGVVDMEDLVFISESANEFHRKSKIFRGDVVVVRTGQAGTAAVVPEELDGANCIDLLIVRRSEQLLSRFVYYYLNSPTAMSQATAQSVGAIQAHYNTSTLAQLVCPKVPRDEQARIVSFLDKAIGRIDDLVTLAKQAIDLFEEYRTRLIADVVTGKLDVREAGASLPDVDPGDAEDTRREPQPTALVDPEPSDSALQPAHP